MLGKTHVAVGVAASLAILQPDTATGIISAVAGGAIGGWICDIDCKEMEYDDDTVPGFILTFLVTH
jgi:inner membrane protein